ncbi:hypothetical protein GY45DRAFT_749609 [Cubamyces sp. BRFM 1775]|nr:hypothetical protein GY45DRAFT_749609 [Cubamyces sp. BRFM 1775]
MDAAGPPANPSAHQSPFARMHRGGQLPLPSGAADYKFAQDQPAFDSPRLSVGMLWRRYHSWALPALLSLFLVLLTWPATSWSAASATGSAAVQLASRADPPRKDDGFTDVVQWDNYTLFLHGQRMFLQ